MNTKLLRKLRNDRRYEVYHAGGTDGFKYSGWWYFQDSKSLTLKRDKKLRKVLEYLVSQYKLDFWILMLGWTIIISFTSGMIYLIINFIAQGK